MKRVIALVFVVGLFLGSVPAAQAAYPDPGAGKTDIFLQNIGADADGSVVLTYTTEAGAAGPGSATYAVSSAIPQWTTRMIPSDVATSPSLASPWAGAVEVASAEPMAALAAMTWDGTAKTAGVYKSEASPAKIVYVPLLVVADTSTFQAKSVLAIQNTEETEATVDVYMRNAAGTTVKTIRGQVIPPKGERRYDLSLSSYRPNFGPSGLGSAGVSSDKNVAVVVTLHWGSADSYSSDAYQAPWRPATYLHFPGVFRWSPKYSELYVQNLSPKLTAYFEVYFRRWDGALSLLIKDQVLAPKGIKVYRTADLAALGTSWRGGVVVAPKAGTTPAALAGVCKYYQTAGVRDYALYNAIPVQESAMNAASLVFPLVVRKRDLGAGNMYSTVFVRNLTGTTGPVTVEIYGPSGSIGSWTVNVSAMGQVELNLASGINLPSDALSKMGTNFTGSMRVVPGSGLQILGAAHLFWDGVGRAGGYTAFRVE